MKWLIILLSAALITACGLDPKGRKKPERPIVPTVNEVPPSVDHNQRPKDKPAQTSVSSSRSEEFTRQFEQKYAGAVSLPVDQLFQMIEVVPPQTPDIPWNCGLVQSNMAKASAAIALGLQIDRRDVANCFDVGDYPLLANARILPSGVSFAKKVGVPLEEVGDDYYFRVGASPEGIATFLNLRLPKGLTATSLTLESLNREQLIKHINDSIAKKMPLITVNVKDAERLRLHYYSIVGYFDGGERLLVLDTTEKGIERLKTFDTANFLAEMNTSQFKSEVLSLLRLIPMIPNFRFFMASDKPKPKLPTEEDLESLGKFNLVLFQ